MTSPLKFHWFLPTNGGDGRQVVGGGHGVDATPSGRPASVAYLGQVARGAEDMGFDAALTPAGAWCEDAWLSTAMREPSTTINTAPAEPSPSMAQTSSARRQEMPMRR